MGTYTEPKISGNKIYRVRNVYRLRYIGNSDTPGIWVGNSPDTGGVGYYELYIIRARAKYLISFKTSMSYITRTFRITNYN